MKNHLKNETKEILKDATHRAKRNNARRIRSTKGLVHPHKDLDSLHILHANILGVRTMAKSSNAKRQEARLVLCEGAPRRIERKERPISLRIEEVRKRNSQKKIFMK
jgi:hypothetical protein